MNKLMKRAAAALLSLAMLGGLPFTAQYGGLLSSETALTAEAAGYPWWIRFDANGGTGKMINFVQWFEDGDTYTLPECKYTAPEGYEFDKWNLGSPGTAVPITGNTTLVAQWKPLPTIEFYVNKPSGVSPTSVSGSMSNITLPSGTTTYTLPECDYSISGYAFIGWDLGMPGTVISVNGTPITLKAQWEARTTISFYPNCEGTTGKMQDVNVKRGSSYTLPECTFKREGYLFDRWDYGYPGTTIVANSEIIKVNAMWNEATTIRFDSNGGSGSMSSVQVAAYSYFTLPSCTFTPPVGCTFDRWDYGKPGDTIYVGSKTITLKAIWKHGEMTVSFDANGGSGTMQDVSIPENIFQYKLPYCEFNPPTDNKYNQFLAWEFDGNRYRQGEMITLSAASSNHIIKAIWGVKPAGIEIIDSYYGYSFTTTANQPYLFTEYTRYEAPEGMVFGGYRWKTTGDMYYPGEHFPPQEWLDDDSIHYYGGYFEFEALWVSPKTLNVYFEAGEGGQGSMLPVKVQNAVKYTIPECTFTAPAGKKFACWYAEDYDGNQYLHPGDAIPAEKSSYNLIAIWEDRAPTDDVKISHNVALNNNFSIAYYIPTATFQDCTDVRLSVKKEVYTDAGVTYEETVLTDPVVQDSGYGEEFIFEYSDIAAKEIGSNLTAVIEADMDGVTYYSEPDVYSVKQYATNKLKNSSDANLKKLLVDMLNYGAAAQTYFNYNTDNLANNKLTLAQKKLATDPSTLSITSDASETAISSPKAQFTGKNLLLGNNVALVFYMTFDSSVNKNNVTLELIYTTVKGEAVIKTVPFSQMKLSGYAAGEYEYDFLDIRAKDACRPVTARILLNGKQISSKITYSVQSYAYNKLNKSTTSAELKTIINALMVYCKSAENYFSA